MPLESPSCILHLSRRCATDPVSSSMSKKKRSRARATPTALTEYRNQLVARTAAQRKSIAAAEWEKSDSRTATVGALLEARKYQTMQA